MERYETILNTIAPDVSFGYTTIHIYKTHELESAQLGYSLSPDGKSLVGENIGDWKESWLVIGYDETCGDPIFIDRSEENYPVYTAFIGKGSWEIRRIAVSLGAFTNTLSAVASVSQGREHPTSLEEHPLSLVERQKVLAIIRRYNPGLDVSFWENILADA